MTIRVHRRSAIAAGAALMAVLLLGGCASGQMKPDATFTASSPGTLVMFGVDVQSQYKAPDFVFRRYDRATGRVDPARGYHASPRLHQVTGGQGILEYLSGRDPRPVGHVYFTINLPPGEWFLWRVWAVHGSGGAEMESAATTLSDGTILISARPGAALYLGEFVLKGKYEEELTINRAPSNLTAAQAELDRFQGVHTKLTAEEEPRVGTFKCLQGNWLERRECEPTKIVEVTSEGFP